MSVEDDQKEWVHLTFLLKLDLEVLKSCVTLEL